MWSCLSFCRRLFFSSMSDCKARSEAGRICRLSRLSSMFLALPWRSSYRRYRSAMVTETRVRDTQFDLVAFSSVTYDFQAHSPDFVIYDDIHHSVPSIHPRTWLRSITWSVLKNLHTWSFSKSILCFRWTSPRRDINSTTFLSSSGE